ncbi:hypothetical protein D3C80_1930070 [compost metagenome]
MANTNSRFKTSKCPALRVNSNRIVRVENTPQNSSDCQAKGRPAIKLRIRSNTTHMATLAT